MDIWRYSFVLLVAILGIAGLVTSYFRAQRSLIEKTTKHATWDYLLVWPLVIKRNSTQRGNIGRVLVGWGIVIILLVVAVVFRW
jgi:hypothetical protein